jgi:hypothetical protein
MILNPILITNNQWNNGMVEKWNTGQEKQSAGGLIPDKSHYYKNRSHSTKPSFPTFHYSMAFDYGKPAEGCLTWPKVPRFRW